MSAQASNWRGNRLLASLSHADFALIEPFLRPVVLKFRQCVEAGNRRVETVVFPYGGIVSVLAQSSDRRHEAEVGVIGYEGMTGVPVVLGTEVAAYTTLVQVPGDGVSLRAQHLRQSLQQSGSLRLALLRYVQVFTIQAAHTALANGQGKVEQRLARWLLMAHDRMPGDELHLTHEFLALVLGVRRAGVTIGLHQLQSEGLISIARGSMQILARDGLERAAAGFYGVPEREYQRLIVPVELAYSL
jgi:CRP-like cAMP-binding protein